MKKIVIMFFIIFSLMLCISCSNNDNNLNSNDASNDVNNNGDLIDGPGGTDPDLGYKGTHIQAHNYIKEQGFDNVFELSISNENLIYPELWYKAEKDSNGELSLQEKFKVNFDNKNITVSCELLAYNISTFDDEIDVIYEMVTDIKGNKVVSIYYVNKIICTISFIEPSSNIDDSMILDFVKQNVSIQNDLGDA